MVRDKFSGFVSRISPPLSSLLREVWQTTTERHVGRHQTIALMKRTMKLHVQNTIL